MSGKLILADRFTIMSIVYPWFLIIEVLVQSIVTPNLCVTPAYAPILLIAFYSGIFFYV